MAVTHQVVVFTRAGQERRHEYASDDVLQPGAVIVLDGRHWLVERVEPAGPIRLHESSQGLRAIVSGSGIRTAVRR